MGDLDFSWNFGVSQSRAGEVVEKHRDREKVASGADTVALLVVDQKCLSRELIVRTGRPRAGR